LAEVQGNILTTEYPDLACYGYDASGLTGIPHAVALPSDVEQVSEILKICHKYKIPIYPRGAGTGTTGAALAQHQGLLLSLTKMCEIIDISTEDLTAVVEPGVITGDLQKKAAKQGLFYPPDPASKDFCTIGGNVATGAGGATAVKYGVTRDYVMALEIVLPGGQVIHAGAKTAKGVVGYDLVRLFVGSEGTLGVATKIWLKLLVAPESVGTLGAFFKDEKEAGHAVVSLFKAGITPRCAELLDNSSLAVVKDMLPFNVPNNARAMVIAEVDGFKESIKAQLDRVVDVFQNNSAKSIIIAQNSSEAELIWKARRSLSPAIKQLGFSGKISEDICVPRHCLPEMIEAVYNLSKETGIKILCFGHAGDGNLHINVLFDKESQEDQKKVSVLIPEIMKLAIRFGGTISGEHGVGLTKKEFLDLEIGPVELSIMKNIKRAFDPHNIMNPGKVF